MKPYLLLFLRGVSLGLLGGLVLGETVTLLQGPRLAQGFLLPYNLLIGSLFGIAVGWGLSLQAMIRKLFHDLFGIFARAVPWPGDERAPAWVTRMRETFGAAAEKVSGLLSWFLGKYVVSRLTKTEPFVKAAERAARSRKPGQGEPSPQELARSALTTLLLPLDRFFWVAYGLLGFAASLFWVLPILLRPRP